MNTKDKLEEKIKEIIYEVGYMDRDYRKSLKKATKQILTLLTSEVEKERERLLKEVEEKVIGEDEGKRLFVDQLGRCNECLAYEGDLHTADCYWHQKIVRNILRAEQRKALSDIGGKGVIHK